MKKYTGRIQFKDGDTVREGIVNGEPFEIDEFVYVPVHVPATNQNMVVNSLNIVSNVVPV